MKQQTEKKKNQLRWKLLVMICSLIGSILSIFHPASLVRAVTADFGWGYCWPAESFSAAGSSCSFTGRLFYGGWKGNNSRPRIMCTGYCILKSCAVEEYQCSSNSYVTAEWAYKVGPSSNACSDTDANGSTRCL